MANFLFNNFKLKTLELDATAPGTVDFAAAGDTIQPTLPDSGGANAPTATDQDMAEITLFNANHQGGDLASKTTTLGVFDAADSLISGPSIEASAHKDVMLIKETGTDANDTLIVLFDLATPVITDGNDVDVQFNVSGILDFGP